MAGRRTKNKNKERKTRTKREIIVIIIIFTKCESFVVNVTGSCGSPEGQLYATRPATCINFEPVRAKSIKFKRNVSAENST